MRPIIHAELEPNLKHCLSIDSSELYLDSDLIALTSFRSLVSVNLNTSNRRIAFFRFFVYLYEDTKMYAT